MKFFICAPDIFERDAVGNYCMAIARILRSSGFEVYLFAQRFDHHRVDVNLIDTMFDQIRECDTVFVSYSIFDPLLERILSLACRKICYFHGVTPPDLLIEFEPVTAELCEASYAQFQLLNNFDLIIANSKFSANTLAEYIPIDTIEILPPVTADMPIFSHVAKTVPYDLGHLDLLVVGRVVPHKRIEDAILILSKLRERKLPAKLCIVGNTPNLGYLEHLMSLIHSHHLEEHVDFKGLLNDAELLDCFYKADAFLSASLHEGFCVPVLEALYIGIPTFVRSGTAAVEIGGAAVAVFDDLDTACMLINQMLSNSSLKNEMIQAGRQRASELFQFNNMNLVNRITHTH